MDTTSRQKYEDEIEIDLGELIAVLWEKAWIIALTAVVLVGITGIVTDLPLVFTYLPDRMTVHLLPVT